MCLSYIIGIEEWLFTQSPVMILAGIGMWWLAKRYDKANDKLDERTEKMIVNNEKTASLLKDLLEDIPNIRTDIREALEVHKNELTTEIRSLKKGVSKL